MDSLDPLIMIPATVIADDRVNWAINNIDKFCILPWLNLHTTPSGDIKLCCSIQSESYVTNDEKHRFNLGRDKISDIWNSMNMMFTREQHRTGNGYHACFECYNMEQVNGHSPRIGQNDNWLERQKYDSSIKTAMEVSTSNTIEPVLPHLPISLELRLGNHCNLQCISCWGMSSSLIQDERKDIIATANDNDEPLVADFKRIWAKEVADVDGSDLRSWYDTDIFYENMRAMAPNLKRLYTTGGEPTLIKANYKMLQMMMDADNLACNIEITSNMKTWNPEFYNRLQHFENVEIQMSLDGMGTVGEYIRYPSDMEEIKKNVERALELASTRPGWVIKVYTVLQAFNYRHLFPIWEFIREMADKYNKNIHWWPITLYMPRHLSLATVNKEQRAEYVEQFIQLANDFNSKKSVFQVNSHTVNACIESIKNPDYDDDLNQKLQAYTKIIDTSRSLNGIELFSKEIYND